MGSLFQLIVMLLFNVATCVLIASLNTAALFSRRASTADKVLFGVTALSWWGMTYLQATTSVQAIRVDLVFFGPIVLGLAVAAFVKWLSLDAVDTAKTNISSIAVSESEATKVLQEQLSKPKQTNTAKSWIIALAFIFGIPLLFVAWMMVDINQFNTQGDLRKKYLFEAMFRDDATQKTFFGDITPTTETWAGFYECNTEDERFKYIIVSRDGRSWIYNRDKLNLWKFSSVGALKNTSVFQTQEVKELFRGSDTPLSLRMIGDNNYEFEFGPIAHDKIAKKIPARLIAPPRFPVKALATDKVKFLGAYSGKYQIKEKSFWAVELWLWEDRNGIWGRYYRGNFTSGNEFNSQFNHHRLFEAYCDAKCLVNEGADIKIQDYERFHLKRSINDQFVATFTWEENPIALKLGAFIPNPLYELAPLASRSENKKWLDAVAIGHDITWKVP